MHNRFRSATWYFPARLALCVAIAGFAGCSSGPEALTVATLAVSSQPRVTASPVEAYTRVARGIMTCWLSAERPLAGRYRFFGDAKTNASGGEAKIIIHEKAENGRKGLKAYSIDFSPSGDTTDVAASNARLSKAHGEQLDADVMRWATGGIGCASADENNSLPVRLPSAKKSEKHA